LEDVSIRSSEEDSVDSPNLQDVWKRWLDQLDLGPDDEVDTNPDLSK